MTGFAESVAFITGAASGIGAAVARELARRGADVALVDRREERLQKICSEIEARGRRALPLLCDVSRDGDLEGAVARTRDTFGRIDIAFANAGFGVTGLVSDLALDEFRLQFETSVFGVIRTVQAVHEDIVASRGCLAITGSVQGYISAPGYSPYSMSKSALRSLAETLWHEYHPHGAGVVLVVPGFVATEFHRIDSNGVPHPAQIPARLAMSAEKAARRIVKAIRKRKREVVIGYPGKIVVFVHRHFPGLVAWIMRVCWREQWTGTHYEGR